MRLLRRLIVAVAAGAIIMASSAQADVRVQFCPSSGAPVWPGSYQLGFTGGTSGVSGTLTSVDMTVTTSGTLALNVVGGATPTSNSQTQFDRNRGALSVTGSGGFTEGGLYQSFGGYYLTPTTYEWITLSGLKPSTWFMVELYAYDNGYSGQTIFTDMTNGSIGTSGTVNYTPAYHFTTNSDADRHFSTILAVVSDTTGKILICCAGTNNGNPYVATNGIRISSRCIPQVFVPTLNPSETVVALATPQQFGAKGDGFTDDTAAFQTALNAMLSLGQRGGGVLYVPSATYLFKGNLNLPSGDSIHGDWKDWTQTGGPEVGATFKIATTGTISATGTAFLTMSDATDIKGINFWYPNQSITNFIPYPFTIQMAGCCQTQNIVLVNSYQGIFGWWSARSITSAIGTPLAVGYRGDAIGDLEFLEDIHFSPSVWAESGLPGAPSLASLTAYTRSNSTGLLLLDLAMFSNSIDIDGYLTGIDTEAGYNNYSALSTFYQSNITNCGTALCDDASSQVNAAWCTFSGDIGIDRSAATVDAGLNACRLLHSCAISGSSLAIYLGGGGATWLTYNSQMHLTNCTVNGMIQHDTGSSLQGLNSVFLAPTQLTTGTGADCDSFNGCLFANSPTSVATITPNFINASGQTGNIFLDSRQTIPSQIPLIDWKKVKSRYAQCGPAKSDLYVATDYGAIGDGAHDDTAAIQSALTAAGTNGGGIVFLPGGRYMTTNTLNVPPGVELRGNHELRHQVDVGSDNLVKVSILEVTAGQGNPAGPVGVALQPNAGIVGVDIRYEQQIVSTSPYAYPATIQGMGSNIYIIGVDLCNTFYGVDLDTYSCGNHFVYSADGSPINTGFKVGNGSYGYIVDCSEHEGYWGPQADTSSPWYSGNAGGSSSPLRTYIYANKVTYWLGNCAETMMKDFSIPNGTAVRCMSEGGAGPDLNAVSLCYDSSHAGFDLESAAPCNLSLVNESWAVVDRGDLTSPQAVEVYTAPGFAGTFRAYNMDAVSSGTFDYYLNQGDVGIENLNQEIHASGGTQINGGSIHFNNALTLHSTTTGYPITLGTGAGTPGQISEVVSFEAPVGVPITSPTNVSIDFWNTLNVGGLTQGKLLNTSTTSMFYQPTSPYYNRDVAMGCGANASSTANGTQASEANDGDPTTGWNSTANDNESITLDLGSVKQLSTVVLGWGAGYASQYNLRTSVDGSTWTTVYAQTSGTGGVEAVDGITVSGRYVQIQGIKRGTTGGYIVNSFEVYCDMAENAPVTASSTSGTLLASNAVDNSYSTRWSSNYTDHEWIYVDLGATRQISNVVLDWEKAFAASYEIDVSNDASTWTSVYSTSAGHGGLETIPVNTTGRYVRMLGIKRTPVGGVYYGYSLWGFEVY